MRATSVASLLVVAIATIASVAAIQAPADDRQPVVWSASDLKWIDNPAIKGAQQAVLWGDPGKTSYGALKKVPAGAVLPAHTHSNLTRFVVLAGTLSFTLVGHATQTLGPQAYGSIPAGIAHAAACQAGGDCVYFETSPGAYDFKAAAAAR